MKQIRALAPHAKKLTLSDTRESIGEKSAARVPVFFNFLKSYRLCSSLPPALRRLFYLCAKRNNRGALANTKQKANRRRKKTLANVFIRTLVLYILIVLLMRVSGKREVGQLELTELVTTFMISELASIPITNNNIPLLYGIIPTVTLICLEVFLSLLCLKSRKVRRAFSGVPAVLIDKGKLNQKELCESRLTLEELLSSLRVLGYSDISSVYYAILEPSGNISVIPKCTERPPTAKELCVAVEESGAEHIIISDGVLNAAAMNRLGFDFKWLNSQLSKNGCKSVSDVFYLGVDDLNKVTLVQKEKKSS